MHSNCVHNTSKPPAENWCSVLVLIADAKFNVALNPNEKPKIIPYCHPGLQLVSRWADQ